MAAKEVTKYTCELSPETLEKAMKELNEDPKTRMIEMKLLIERLEKTPGLIPRTDPKFLMTFLRARKFDQERTYQLLINYYKVRHTDPEAFNLLKPSRVRHLWDDGMVEVLKHRAEDGSFVVIFRTGRYNPERHSVVEIARLLYTVYRKLVENEEAQVHGVRIILDLAELTWKKALHLTPVQAMRISNVVQAIVPMRLKYIAFIRESHVIDIIFPLVKMFLKAKLLKRTVLLGNNLEKIHEFIKPEYLPTDLSGEQPPFHNTEWNEAYLASDADFEEDSRFGFVNMSINSEEEANKSEDAGVSGLGGTFKKLEI